MILRYSIGHAMAEAAIRRPVTRAARFQSQASPCRIFGWQSGTGVRYSLSI